MSDHDAKTKPDGGASVSTAGLGGWVACEDGLPDIPDGELSSVDVLAGCWITYDWLRDGHPDKRRFIFGACRVLRETNLREFPHGKRWHTFGPSHNQITHWQHVAPPNEKVRGDPPASSAERPSSTGGLGGG